MIFGCSFSKDFVRPEFDAGIDSRSFERLNDVLLFNWGAVFFTGAIFFASNLLSLWSVTVIKACLENIKTSLKHPDRLYLYQNLGIFLAVQISSSLLTSLGEYLMSRLGLQTRQKLVSQLAKSVLSADRLPTKGSLVNAMTVDVSAVENLFSSVHFIWAAPIQSFFLVVSLYLLIGKFAFIGVSVLLVYSLFQSVGLALSKRFRKRFLGLADERLQLFQQALASIKLIKAMALEQITIESLLSVRCKEVACLKWDLSIRGIAVEINAFFTLAATTITTLALIHYKAADFNTILAAHVLFTRLRHQLNMIPIAISAWNNGKVSFDRIRPFILAEKSKSLASMHVEKSIDKIQVTTSDDKILVIPCGAVVRVVGTRAKGFLQDFITASKHRFNVAYCPETPWLASGTIRENILFGQPYDPVTYHDVLKMFELVEDLSALGDSRQVGGNEGAGISGGQRARICLARAAYSQADIWILEDILTSIDEDTKSKIIGNIELSGATVLYIGEASFENMELWATDTTITTKALRPLIPSKFKSPCCCESIENPKTLIKDESALVNCPPISARVLGDWLRGAGGLWFLAFIVAVQTAVHICRLGNDLQLAKMELGPSDLAWYLVFCGVQVVGPLVYTLFTYIRGLCASDQLHRRTIKSVINAPYSQHPTSSLGTLINRFSKDQEYADISLPIYIGALATSLSSLVFQSYGIVSKNSYMSIPLLLTFIFYYVIGSRFRNRIRGLRRDESDSRNTTCSLATDITSGFPVIKAYDHGSRYQSSVASSTIRTCALRLIMTECQIWFQLLVKIMGNLGTVLIAVLSVALGLDPAIAALAFTYSIGLPTAALSSVRQLAQTESHMVAYERIHAQMEQFSQEDECSNSYVLQDTPSITWKDVGLTLDGQRILESVSIRVEPGDRVGVVGRTGSGKSSLLLSLLRLYESETGNILLNDVDIRSFSLLELRESISYVPQEPICSERHTLRYNLDPKGSIPDSELWKVVKALGILMGLDDHIDSRVDLATRERLNLARGLVRKCSVLLLDEPLASATSLELESLLSGHLEEYLVGVTLVIVSHRAKWLQFCTRTICMSHGRAVNT